MLAFLGQQRVRVRVRCASHICDVPTRPHHVPPYATTTHPQQHDAAMLSESTSTPCELSAPIGGRAGRRARMKTPCARARVLPCLLPRGGDASEAAYVCGCGASPRATTRTIMCVPCCAFAGCGAPPCTVGPSGEADWACEPRQRTTQFASRTRLTSSTPSKSCSGGWTRRVGCHSRPGLGSLLR